MSGGSAPAAGSGGSGAVSEGGDRGGNGGGGPHALIAGKSCRGCVFFSRALQERGKEPVCLGISAAELLPAALFLHRQQLENQQRQQQPQQQSHSPHSQQRADQRPAPLLEKQQKILEEFRYACIGYSLYPTHGQEASASPASATSHPSATQQPPTSSSSSPSSQLAVPAWHNDRLAPERLLGQGAVSASPSGRLESGSASWHPEMAGRRDAAESASWHREDAANKVEGSTRAWSMSARYSHISGDCTRVADPLNADARAQSSANERATAPSEAHGGAPGEAGASQDAAHEQRKAGSTPPRLPVCVGIEILAGTKGERMEQPQQQPLHHAQPVDGIPRQGDAGMAAVDEAAAEAQASLRPAQEDRRQPLSSDGHAESKQSPAPVEDPASGISMEEFARRYVRSARLIARRCVTNYEKIKAAVQNSVDDILRGDRSSRS